MKKEVKKNFFDFAVWDCELWDPGRFDEGHRMLFGGPGGSGEAPSSPPPLNVNCRNESSFLKYAMSVK